MVSNFDVVVIGAGGAGMMCARTASLRGQDVLLIDHATTIGKKILISGGGRCNFTNIYTSAESYVSNNPHFAKSALARFTPGDFIELVEKHKIPYHEKKLGQLFCDITAQDIVDMLVSECEKAGVKFRTGCDVKTIAPPKESELPTFLSKQIAHSRDSDAGEQLSGRFFISTTRGSVSTEKLVIATGGLSVPKVGATGFGYDLARNFGLKIVQTVPALDGFVFNQKDARRFEELQGISVDSEVSCNDASFRENILFTHRGLSGPASLQASLYWNQGDMVSIDLLPDIDIGGKLIEERSDRSKRNIRTALADWLPKRLAHRICEDKNVDDSLQHLSDKVIGELSEFIKGWPFHPGSTVGYVKAEVTRGGVDTDELSSKTMECKRIPGLYFIGEVVDVTGQLGGYNFQWAWASGFAAGEHA